MVPFRAKMEKNMMANGNKIKNKAKVSINGQMETDIKVLMLKERERAKV